MGTVFFRNYDSEVSAFWSSSRPNLTLSISLCSEVSGTLGFPSVKRWILDEREGNHWSLWKCLEDHQQLASPIGNVSLIANETNFLTTSTLQYRLMSRALDRCFHPMCIEAHWGAREGRFACPGLPFLSGQWCLSLCIFVEMVLDPQQSYSHLICCWSG